MKMEILFVSKHHFKKITFQAKMCYNLGIESKNTHAEMLSFLDYNININFGRRKEDDFCFKKFFEKLVCNALVL